MAARVFCASTPRAIRRACTRRSWRDANEISDFGFRISDWPFASSKSAIVSRGRHMPVIHLKSPEEIEKMRASGKILARTLRLVSEEIAPGKTPKQLDALAHRLIEEAGGRPNFLNYRGSYPAATCISVNSTVVHGIPNDLPLE